MTSKYTTDLRLIAILTMLIDHIGFIFFPNQPIFRIIGRFSFPLFAWGIAQGAKYTHNAAKYAWRLFVFALIAQYPYYLFGTIAPSPIAKLNVIFTLLLGLLAILSYRSHLSKLLKIACIYLCCFFSLTLNSDYQIIGVLSVLLSYIFMTNFPALFISQLFLFSLPITFSLITQSLNNLITFNIYLPLFAPLAFFLTRLPQSRLSKFKYLFYLVYPLQFLIIYLIKTHLK